VHAAPTENRRTLRRFSFEARYDVRGDRSPPNSRWTFAGGFRPGDQIEIVFRRFKVRGDASAKEIEFGGDTDSVRFRVADRQVKSIRYECYTG
jgi:hypothetical protein